MSLCISTLLNPIRLSAALGLSSFALFGLVQPAHAANQCVYTPNSLKTLVKPVEPGDTDGPDETETAGDPQFRYHPPGKLHPSDKRKGYTNRKVFLEDIVFPLKLPKGMHAHMNSQIYGRGGGGWGGVGAAGGRECDLKNYNPFAQYDNFCEVRGWKMPMCPAGTGHQGLDIRPPSCKDATWPIVAVDDGIITRVRGTSTSVVQKGQDGTIYNYLHMHPRSIVVRKGQSIKKGDLIGKVSKYMGGRRSTTLHLHFAASQTIRIKGKTRRVYVPIYTSLIAAYRRAKGLGDSIDENGDLIVDAKYEIGAKPTTPEEPTDPVKPTDPEPETPEPDPLAEAQQELAEAKREVASLTQELNALKVDTQRKIEEAEGVAEELRTKLQQSQDQQ